MDVMDHLTASDASIFTSPRERDGAGFPGGDPQEIRRVLTTLIGNLPGIVYRCRNDQNWTMLFISNGSYELTGYWPSDFTQGKIQYADLIHPDDRDGVWNDVQESIRKKRPFHLVYRIITATGDEKWVWEQGCGIFDDQGELTSLEGYVTDITARMTAESERWASHCLLETIRIVQSRFISENNPHVLFDDLIKHFLELSQSEYGFIGEILSNDNGKLFMRSLSMANIVWDDRTRNFFEKNAPENMEFHNLDTLFGAVIKTGQMVISNDPAHDPRSGGLPPGHPPLRAFAGLPLYHGDRLVGILGLANRPSGYDIKLIEYLQPLLTTCAGIVEAYKNILRRKTAEDALRESEGRYHDLFENAVEMIQSVSIEGKFLFVNREWTEIMGYSDTEIKGMSAFDLIHPDSLPHCREVFARIMAGESIRNIHAVFVAKNGRKIHVEGSVSPRFINGVVVATHGFFRDESERRRLEKAILEIRESEQRRIGQDLHDGLGQHLTGIALMGKVLQKKLSEKGMAESSIAGEIVQLVTEAASQTRLLSKGLHPVSLESGGLTIALEELCASAAEMFGIACVVRPGRQIPVHDHATAIHLYRIAQEAVNNAVRHGRSGKVEIALLRENGMGRLEIRDNGLGLPTSGEEGEGMGLHIMRYRARMIGASLAFRRGDAGGVSVICVFPNPDTEQTTGVAYDDRALVPPAEEGAHPHR